MQNQLDSHTGILAAQQDFVEFVKGLEHDQPATIDGVYGSSCALAASAALSVLYRDSTNPIVALVVVAKQQDVDKMCDDLRVFSDCSPLPYPLTSSSDSGVRHSDDQVHGQRVRLLKRLANPTATSEVVVTSIAALLQPVPSLEELQSNHKQWQVGTTIDLKESVGLP